jgi:VanZ family protein
VTSWGRLAVAIAVAAAVVLSAPFLGQLRSVLRSTFPGHFTLIVGGAVALALAVALGIALARIREHRAARWAVIALAAATALAYVLATGTGIPEVDAVERVHFVQYGVIAWLFYRAWRPLADPASFALPLLAGFVVGTADEWFQWFVPNRVGEARDVLLNVVALACGLAVGAALDPPQTCAFRLAPASRRLLGRVGALAIIVFGAFVDVVHLGHVVHVPGVGQFKSRYTDAQLERLATDRIERWRTHPPLVLVRFSREDQYLDEGFWHIRARNRLWGEERYAEAWAENEILETFFVPVLDTPTYATPSPPRWPAEQKAHARASAGEPAGYVSAAEPHPLVTWPRTLYRVTALMLAGLVLLIGSAGTGMRQPRGVVS